MAQQILFIHLSYAYVYTDMWKSWKMFCNNILCFWNFKEKITISWSHILKRKHMHKTRLLYRNQRLWTNPPGRRKEAGWTGVSDHMSLLSSSHALSAFWKLYIYTVSSCHWLLHSWALSPLSLLNSLYWFILWALIPTSKLTIVLHDSWFGGVCTILTLFLKSTHEDGNISDGTFLFSLALNAVQLLKCNCKNGAMDSMFIMSWWLPYLMRSDGCCKCQFCKLHLWTKSQAVFGIFFLAHALWSKLQIITEFS